MRVMSLPMAARPLIDAPKHWPACPWFVLFPEARSRHLADLKKKKEAWAQLVLVDVITWLVLNGLASEASKRQLLYQQDLRNLWRSAACSVLEARRDPEAWLLQARTKLALAEVVSDLDFTVPASCPGQGQEGPAVRLRKEAALHVAKGALGECVWSSEAARDQARAEAEGILKQFEASHAPWEEDADHALSREQVQEQEQEHEEEVEEDHEQEAEQEEELDRLPEAPAPQKYAKESEEATPWPVRGLVGKSAALPFYPLADFAVNKGILNESSPALEGLPGFVMISENHYRRSWRLTSVRRLRNVACFLEWVPSAGRLKRFTVSPSALSQEQRFRLREALELCSGSREDCSAGFGQEEVRALCEVLDLTNEGEAYIARMPTGSRVTLAELERALGTQDFFRMQEGRFFVALGLTEAEHLRGALHLLAGQSWLQDCCLALRCIGCKESVNESLLDFVGPVRESAELGFQLQAAEQLLRFLNSAEDFQAREVNVLLRSMQLTRTQDRLPWWLDVRACRRRAHRHWNRLAVSKVFMQMDEFEDWATKALLLRVRWALAAQRLWPSDAFRFMDTSNNGCLQRRDLAAGLESLGVRSEGLNDARWMQQVTNLFRWIAQEGREVIFLEDFRTALEQRDADLEGFSAASPASRASGNASEGKDSALTKTPRQADPLTPSASPKKPSAGEGGPSTATNLPLATPAAVAAAVTAAKTIEEIPASGTATPSPLARPRTPSCSPEGGVYRLSPDMCRQLSAGRFKHKWQKHSAFHAIWFANDAGAKPSLVVWAPVELVPRGKFLGVKRGSHAVKERLSFGHYVSMSPTPPTVELLEVTDEQYSGFFAKHPRDELNRFLDTFFPHPIRFRQVWHLKETALKFVYMWAPVPPSADFVACGMVCTTDDEAPSLQEVRCLPRLWAERSPASRAVQVWCAVGEEGLAASAWLPGGEGTGFLQLSTGAAVEVAPELQHMQQRNRKFYASLPQTE
ncbi:CPK24 [Symbiodinium natans]|uniref:CPK24 protein n=1 Tax=Symbiodinium natans TaxID=878477 RepID=A0A812LXX0_9DINO|nr:CPK24 [Symbiodinium natans]